MVFDESTVHSDESPTQSQPEAESGVNHPPDQPAGQVAEATTAVTPAESIRR